jgi:hypothetical protein
MVLPGTGRYEKEQKRYGKTLERNYFRKQEETMSVSSIGTYRTEKMLEEKPQTSCWVMILCSLGPPSSPPILLIRAACSLKTLSTHFDPEDGIMFLRDVAIHL